MCTISYLPLSSGGFLLTQNRDESPLRPAAIFPSREYRQQKRLLFPKDPQGGGSWIATDEKQRLVCLMNGAINQHPTSPPYRLSRGQVVLDAAASTSFRDFYENYPLEGIEPFTLLYLEASDTGWQLNELRWKGNSRELLRHAPEKPRIWSAPQLYSLPQQQAREQWFRNWLQPSPAFTSEAILQFHKETGKEAPTHSLILNREEKVKTLSITQIVAAKGSIQMTYTPSAEGEKI